MLKQPMSEDERERAINIAKKNSWSGRIEKMSALIENMAHERRQEREKTWKVNLSHLYKKTKKSLIPLAGTVFIAYVLIFYTPLLWFLASPLRISDVPRKADVIMALGGGVGESGKVGQGHEERVDSAVRLYREGFADKIIYSSGYRYIMKEAQVMKVLSVFMGVEEDDIIVDKGPINTYTMVRHLEEFMDENNWKSAIVISSPYHMRRLKLLCDKYLKGKKIYLVPVKKSSFYARGRRVKIKQINGIIHEYLGILYYKVRGYL